MSRLKILFLPAWYPREENPVEGIFIREHAKAALLYNDIVVLFACPDSFPQSPKLYRISQDIEDGIRTIRVRHGGIVSYFRRKLVIKEQNQSGLSYLESKPAIISRKLFRIPIRIIKWLLYYWSIFAAFHRLVKEGWRPDIIHAHIFIAGVPAVILGKIYRIPVIITEHWSVFPLNKLTLFDRIRVRFAMNRARLILPVSDNLKKHIKRHGVKNRFCVVPNTVDTRVFYPLLNRGKRKNEIKNILMVAWFKPIKGVPYLLEALNQIKDRKKDFILDIIGDGPNRAEYEKMSADLGLSDVVRFHGLKTKEEIAKFMRECDFFILPSLWENLPCVLIEAIASGASVIATDVGGVKEIVNENVGVLIPSKQTEVLKKSIEYMLYNCGNYSPGEITKYAKERFSYEVVGLMLEKIYRELLIKCR